MMYMIQNRFKNVIIVSKNIALLFSGNNFWIKRKKKKRKNKEIFVNKKLVLPVIIVEYLASSQQVAIKLWRLG